MAAIILKYKAENGNKYKVRGSKYSGPTQTYTLGARDGYMYLSVPEEVYDSHIPQPSEVDISVVTMTPTISADMCEWVIPILRIDSRTRQSIRQKYSIEDEFKALRTDDQEYKSFVEDLISAGKQKKLEILGLADISEDAS